MPQEPHGGSKVREAPDREIGKSGENRRKVVPHREFQPAAAFRDRENRSTLGPACGLPMCIQFLRPRATGRMEFSAKPWMRSVSARTNVTYMASRLSGAGRVRHKEGTLVQGWAIST